MRRAALTLTLSAALLAPNRAAAQPEAPRVYTMSVKVDLADIATWTEYYQRYEVPILEALVEDGALLAFDLWMHDTGGEHTLSYNFVVPNFNAVAEVGDLYREKLNAAGAAAFGALLSTVREMTDAIWYITDSNIPEGRSPSPYVYESSYQVEGAGLEQWNAEFEEYLRPGLEKAMEEGLLSAWAKLDHSIGGPWNSRFVYWLDSWDSIDDLFALIGETAQELGVSTEGAAAVRGHTDVIWRPAPRSGN